MPTRDQLPYVEATDRCADGTTLHALHNLTAEDLLLVLEGLAHRVLLCNPRLRDTLGTPEARRQLEARRAERLQLLITAMTTATP
jgi:hypothetical protein